MALLYAPAPVPLLQLHPSSLRPVRQRAKGQEAHLPRQGPSAVRRKGIRSEGRAAQGSVARRKGGGAVQGGSREGLGWIRRAVSSSVTVSVTGKDEKQKLKLHYVQTSRTLA